MESNGRKKRGWIKLYPGQWILGSTRGEMTNAQRAVWIDFLALAYLNDPPGQIDFITYRRLANQINISPMLLKSTISEAIRYKKIELVDTKGNILEPCSAQKETKNDPKRVQGVSNGDTLQPHQSQVGFTPKIIIILKWNEYQSEYLRQKPYRQRRYEEEEVIEGDDEQGKRLQTLDPKVVTKVTPRGEERRYRGEIDIEETKKDKSDKDFLEDNEIPLENHPSSESKNFTDGKNGLLQEFLARLGSCPGYPLNDYNDTIMFNHVYEDYPGIDILRELEKKISWWNEHPEALELAESPRQKLVEWFEKEFEFQNREDNG